MDEVARRLIDQLRGVGPHHTDHAAYRASLDVHIAEKLADRLAALTSAINASAASSSAQAAALVRWTKWYVFATVAILL